MPTATAPQPLQKIDASQRAEIIEAIKRDGAVIVKNFTSQEKVDQVNAEVRPHLDADKPWKVSVNPEVGKVDASTYQVYFQGALFAPEVRRCNRLVARSKTFRDTWLVDPLVTEVTEHFLNKTTSCWYDDQKHTYTSKPIVNAAITIEVRPGTDKQRLHRDDKVHHVEHPDQTLTGYRVGTDMSMTLFVAGTQTTKQNGATLVSNSEIQLGVFHRWNIDTSIKVVPGSHLWDMERYPTPEEVIYAEMMPGELYMMLGGTYHAGGANQTLNQNRPMHGMWFCRGYLRNEVSFLATSADIP